VNADGSCCFFVLIDVNAFTSQLFPPTFKFPPDSTTVMGAAEASGDITTKDVSTFFFSAGFPVFRYWEAHDGLLHRWIPHR